MHFHYLFAALVLQISPSLAMPAAGNIAMHAWTGEASYGDWVNAPTWHATITGLGDKLEYADVLKLAQRCWLGCKAFSSLHFVSLISLFKILQITLRSKTKTFFLDRAYPPKTFIESTGCADTF